MKFVIKSRVISLLLLAAIVFNCLLITSCSLFEKTPYQNLVQLRELLMNEEEFSKKMNSFGSSTKRDVWVTEYAKKIDDLLCKLGIGFRDSIFDDDIVAKANAKLKLTKSDIQRYIEEYSVADLMELAMDLRIVVGNELDEYKTYNKKIYMPTIYNIFVVWCMELRPDEFIDLRELKENSTSGFYGEHKDALPIAREESFEGTQYMDVYTVKYYGDFAVEHSVQYNYSDGSLGWEDGEFVDNHGGLYTETFESLYYKGVHVSLIYKKGQKSGSDFDDRSYFYIYVPENKNYINYIVKSDRGLVWFQYCYFED